MKVKAQKSFELTCMKEAVPYLEYGVHHDCQRPIPRKLRDFKNVKAPFIYMLQLLLKNHTDSEYHYCVVGQL